MSVGEQEDQRRVKRVAQGACSIGWAVGRTHAMERRTCPAAALTRLVTELRARVSNSRTPFSAGPQSHSCENTVS